jgi:hypothetical protein
MDEQEIIEDNLEVEQGTELPDDTQSLKELVDRYRQEAEDAKRKISEANGNAKNLRLKKKSIEQELAELREFKRQQEDAAKQAELSKLDESEKLKRLLQEEQESKKVLMSQATAAQKAASEARLEAQLLQMDVSEKGLKLIKPMLNAKMAEDSDLDLAETLQELKEEFPALFKQKAEEQKKQVKVPASTGAPAQKVKEPKITQERQRVGDRSESNKERLNFKKDVLPKYGITI